MSSGSGSGGHGLTFWGAMQILFIALKLMGYIDWPWWMVFWPLLVDVCIVVLFFIYVAVLTAIDKRRKW